MALDILLSDRLRAGKLVVAAVLAAGLGVFYTHLQETVPITWPQCVSDPHRFDGTPLTFPLWTVTAVDGPDNYEVSWVIRNVPVVGDTADLEVGQTISVLGTFSADGPAVVETFREIHRWRRAKVALGALGVMLALGAAPFGLRVRRGYLEERSRMGGTVG